MFLKNLVTLFEAVPKDKKQKEDKSTPIGQSILDLWPLLKSKYSSCHINKTYESNLVLGQSQFSTTVPVYPIPGSFLETQGEQNQVVYRSTRNA